eukprot:SAG31_NODE_916_length_11047_cov_3.507033_1_plen_226_part_00
MRPPPPPPPQRRAALMLALLAHAQLPRHGAGGGHASCPCIEAFSGHYEHTPAGAGLVRVELASRRYRCGAGSPSLLLLLPMPMLCPRAQAGPGRACLPACLTAAPDLPPVAIRTRTACATATRTTRGCRRTAMRRHRRSGVRTGKYLDIPRNTSKYLEIPQNTSKHLTMSRNTSAGATWTWTTAPTSRKRARTSRVCGTATRPAERPTPSTRGLATTRLPTARTS